MKTQVGYRIKELRTARKMTLSDLSKRVGVTTSAISAYETGDRNPSYAVLMKLANVFRVSTDNLLGRSDKYNVDVTHLTQAQRFIIRDTIMYFEELNTLKPKENRSNLLTQNEFLSNDDE